MNADGRRAGFEFIIFGGAHGDLPLTEGAGALIGDACSGMAESAIIDLSGIGTKAGERRFMLAFLTQLYRKAAGEPVHLIIDEADMFAPQVIRDRDQEPAKLLGMMETIVRRGRIKGFIPWLITQRPQVVNKDVLSQADALIAMKMTAKQDRDALAAWVEGCADISVLKGMHGELPTLPRGTGFVWFPARGIFAKTAFGRKTTFDSSATPKRGEKQSRTILAPLNVAALEKQLSAIKDEAARDDPKALRAEIARLKAASKTPAPDRDALAREYQRGKADERKACIEETRAAVAKMRGILHEIDACVSDAGKELDQLSSQTVAEPANKRAPRPVATKTQEPSRQATAGATYNASNLPMGEYKILVAAVQFGGVGRNELMTLTGYKRSSRDAYIQRLLQRGLVTISGSKVIPTQSAIGTLGDDYKSLPTGVELQDYWRVNLPAGERIILQKLIDAYPETVSREVLSLVTGYKRSSRDAYIQRLKARRLVELHGPAVCASGSLF